MNMINELNDIIEILENQYKISSKYSTNSNEYRIGMAAGLKLSLNVIKDLKKRIDDSEKIIINKKSKENDILDNEFIQLV